MVLNVWMFWGFFLFTAVAVDSGQVDPLKKPEISSLRISSDVKYRFATTLVESRIKNVDVASREAIFDVTLPNEAFITNLTLEIDGKVIVGEIKEKEVAKQQYEAAKQRGESAGYIGTSQRETNRFNLAVTVAPQSKVSFNLTYQELLKRKHGHYEQVIYIDPGQPVPEMDISVKILESREITMLRVPPLRNDIDEDISDLKTITAISQPTPNTAEVKFVPSIEFQTAQSTSGMAGQFVVQYDVERDMDGGDVLLVNGYFVHFFAPEGFTPIPNDLLFILDVSGSMSGTKMSQLKDAMQSIISQLNEGDRINIMTFSGTTSFWKTEMVDILNEDMMEEVKAHIQGLQAGGWTNIELALRNGIDFLGRSVTENEVRSPVIVFLTDGEATQGITSSDVILQTVRKLNEGNIPIFSLAFGKYADYTLVKKIAIQNNGLGRKIYEASDAAMQIAGFYNEISVTLLSNITFQYLDAPVANVTKHTFTNYFNGSEIVVCGKVGAFYFEENKGLNLKISSNSVQQTNLVLTGLGEKIVDVSDNLTNTEDFEIITEKIWAYLTIKQFLDKELAAESADEKKAYRRQALDLSIQYGFVTPLTSMVVTLPNEQQATQTGTEEIGFPSMNDPVALPRIASAAAGLANFQTGLSYGRYPGLPGLGRSRPSYDPGFSRGHMPALALYDSVDSDDSVPMSKFAPAVLTPGHDSHQAVKDKVSSKKRQKKNHRKNKQQKGRNKHVLSYPLTVKFWNIEEPFCFNLFHKKLETENGNYLLYTDNDLLAVVVQLTKTSQGRWIKQGGIRKVTVFRGVSTKVLESYTDDNGNGMIRDNTTGTNIPGDYLIESQWLNITVSAADEFLTLRLGMLENLKPPLGNGVINQLWAKRIALLKQIKKPGKPNKNKPPRVLAKFRIDGKRSVADQRMMEGDKKCWNLRPASEENLVNLSTATAAKSV